MKRTQDSSPICRKPTSSGLSPMHGVVSKQKASLTSAQREELLRTIDAQQAELLKLRERGQVVRRGRAAARAAHACAHPAQHARRARAFEHASALPIDVACLADRRRPFLLDPPPLANRELGRSSVSPANNQSVEQSRSDDTPQTVPRQCGCGRRFFVSPQSTHAHDAGCRLAHPPDGRMQLELR